LMWSSERAGKAKNRSLRNTLMVPNSSVPGSTRRSHAGVKGMSLARNVMLLMTLWCWGQSNLGFQWGQRTSTFARSVTDSEISDQKEGQGAPPNVTWREARAMGLSWSPVVVMMLWKVELADQWIHQ
jgi:hypothetical protein